MKRYCPSNGTEGMLFQAQWCDNCRKRHGCRIVLKTMLLDVDDPKYPEQWHYNDTGTPVCSAFDDTVPTPGQKERTFQRTLEKRGQLRLFQS